MSTHYKFLLCPQVVSLCFFLYQTAQACHIVILYTSLLCGVTYKRYRVEIIYAASIKKSLYIPKRDICYFWGYMGVYSPFALKKSRNVDPFHRYRDRDPKVSIPPTARHGEQFGGIRDFAEKRCGECAMHITRAITLMRVAKDAVLRGQKHAQKCSWHTHFPSKSRMYPPHPGHARDFAWYRGQRPSPARVIKMSHSNNSRTRKCGRFVA